MLQIFQILRAVNEFTDDDNNFVDNLAKATVAVLAADGISGETIVNIISTAENGSSAHKTVAIIVLADLRVDYDRPILKILVQLFENNLEVANLERDDKAEFQRVSTLCAFKKIINSINMEPSTDQDDWNILNNIVAAVLDADGVRKGSEDVCFAAVDLLTAIIVKQSEDRIRFAQNRLFWQELISDGKFTLFDIISRDSRKKNASILVGKFYDKLEEIYSEE